MDWVGKRFYSFNSIIRALQNQAKGVTDNENLPTLALPKYNRALLIGGGPSVVAHSQALRKFLTQNPDILLIHASSKNALSFRDLSNDQIFCLVGNEGLRMEDVFQDNLPENILCVLPSFPRKMGTYIPIVLNSKAFELPQSDMFEPYSDSHTGIALQILFTFNIQDVLVTGYDGYYQNTIDTKSAELFQENKFMFLKIRENSLFKIKTVTPSAYGLEELSIYSLL